MAIENDVRAASEEFYSALNRMLNGDAGPLGDIWSHSATVTTMHPIGGREVGWDQVRGSWEQVAELTTQGQVSLSDQFLRARSAAQKGKITQGMEFDVHGIGLKRARRSSEHPV